MSNEELAIRIKAGIDTAENMSLLYDQVKGFIHSVAWWFRGREELEDLEQEGYLALYDAIDGFDPVSGYTFLTYAGYWIRQRIQRYIHDKGTCVRLPVYLHERIDAYKELVKAFRAEYNREPSEGEIAHYLGLGIDQVQSLKRDVQMANLDSLDRTVEGMDGSQVVIGDIVPDKACIEDEAVDRVQAEQLKAVLWGMVDKLPDQQSAVMRKRYQEGMTLRGAGEAYGMSPESIRRIEGKALRELRKPKRANVLRSFLPESDRIYGMGLSGNGVGRFNRTWTSSTERAALRLVEG